MNINLKGKSYLFKYFQNMKLTIVIGCFNERSTILKAIEQAKALNIDKEIIVIDTFGDKPRCLPSGYTNVLIIVQQMAQEGFWKD